MAQMLMFYQPPPTTGRDSSDDEIVGGGPIAPIRPQGGRPGHANRGTRSDDAPSASLTGLVPPPPSTPPPKRRKTKKNGRRRLVDFATDLPVHLQASPSRPVRAQPGPKKKKKQNRRRKNRDSGSDSDSEGGSQPALRLNRIQHRPEKGWVNAGSCHTTKAYQLFEDWKNDYSPENYFQPRSINIIHASDPADRKKDIRARPFTLCWNTPDFRAPEGVPTDTPVPIFRILYSCLGHCTHGSSTSDTGDDDSHSQSDTESNDNDSAPTQKKVPHRDPNSDKVGELNKLLDAKSIRKTKPPAKKCSVKLHASFPLHSLSTMADHIHLQAEVYSDDLSRVPFFQQGTHPEAQSEYLDMSPHIRQCILEMSHI
ncbi:hypothetical protein C8F04DRAFT_1182658 [Mycena alexandri]|uniref:Uncharacterized protein n=1 Tax=Mycena alexandri TaxID=1745969 RepID=A0AAD6X7F6_9AGAR|nr:hypothetical protein C8F04DRAFT_1182658 [Mycena alexandri]